MKYKLVPEYSDILLAPTERFNFENPPCDPIELANDMINIMRDSQGVGLTANQIGLPYSVFVMEGDPAWVCFNPKIITVSAENIVLQEGCLSYPDLHVKILRPERVKVRFTTPSGVTTTKSFDGWHARCVFHEMDHIEGKLFYKRATMIQMEAARKLKKTIIRNRRNK